MTNPFYSTPLGPKIAALSLIADAGYPGGVQALLDDIADGCGGCERASFGTADGKVRWVTVLHDEGHRVYYATIVTDGYGENAPILRATYGSWSGDMGLAQDSHAMYAYVAQQFEEGDME